MDAPKCTQTSWDNRQAVEMTAFGYTALLVPSLGANVLRLIYKDKETGKTLDILRTPKDAQTLLDDPYAYGVPVLFPANRVGGAAYSWDGINYTFPANYPNNVHIHGVLHGRPWPNYTAGANANAAFVQLELDTEKDPQLFSHFPLAMKICLKIVLNKDGLFHNFAVINSSKHHIPVGLAYHTAFNVPFCKNGGDVRLLVPLESRCVDEPIDRLPNGASIPLNAFEREIASCEGAPPLKTAIDYLYRAKPGTSRAILRDDACGFEVVYTAGDENHYWILWNKTTKEGFIAIEPQTWLSNAMGQKEPQKHHAIFVAPHTSWQGSVQISARSI